MPTDLNAMNLPTGEHEIFEPENAWADAPARIVVQVNKMRGGTYQIGTGESGSHWIRSHAGGAWGEWQELVPPPDPPVADAEAAKAEAEADDEDDEEGDEASDEYQTTDMKPAKRGPGRPRKS